MDVISRASCTLTPETADLTRGGLALDSSMELTPDEIEGLAEERVCRHAAFGHEEAGRAAVVERTSGGRASSHSGIWWWAVEGKIRMATAPIRLRTKEQTSATV